MGVHGFLLARPVPSYPYFGGNCQFRVKDSMYPSFQTPGPESEHFIKIDMHQTLGTSGGSEMFRTVRRWRNAFRMSTSPYPMAYHLHAGSNIRHPIPYL